MKSRIILFLFAILPFVSVAQNNNGQLDELSEFVTRITVPFTMPDGINLMTDIYLPITRDSQTVTIDLAALIPLPIPGLGKEDIVVIPKGTQLFIYDSIMVKSSSGLVDSLIENPTPYSLPLIFTRTPYEKHGDQTGEVIALFGYAYALQDMRGRYTSQGVYMPMYSDSWNKNPYHSDYGHILDVTDLTDPRNGNRHEDGANSVDILATGLSRSLLTTAENSWLTPDQVPHINDQITNGSIGMFGPSALGNTQYQAAAARRINPDGPGLKCLFPIVATNEHFKYTGYQNGVFRERIVTGWLRGQIFTGTDDDLIPNDHSIDNNIHTSADYDLPNKYLAANLAIDHFVQNRYPKPDGTLGFAGYYPNSRGRSDMDASRAPVNEFGEGDPNGLFSRYTNKQVPTYHATGWWDIFTDGQIETWALMRQHTEERIRRRQKIIIGPWVHQTMGATETGDMRGTRAYPSNVTDLLGFDVGNLDFNSVPLGSVLRSEIISWFRDNLNYNDYAKIREPKVRIPENTTPTTFSVGGLADVRVFLPSQDFIFPYNDLLDFFNGTGGLKNLPIRIEYKLSSSSTWTATNTTIDVPASGEPIIKNLVGGDKIEGFKHVDFDNDIPNVRFYVPGPVNDGVPGNEGLGNYWFGSDTFPLTSGVNFTKYYFHQDGAINKNAPQNDEGYKMYVHNPDDPILTIGGANMIVRTPQGDRNSQGPMNLADPLFAPYTMDRSGVISFEMEVTDDSLCIIGFPVMNLWAKTNPGGVVDGPTDTDFFIRITDVYPDGSTYFVTEGAVNARARDYARKLADGEEDNASPFAAIDNTPFTNITSGELYEYRFNLMPIAYTWGKGHKVKILISSSNYNRYQVNPNLPMNEGEFFRRQPGDGKTYVFNGETMTPRVAVQRVAFSPNHPTNIELPVFDKNMVNVKEESALVKTAFNALVYPNPATQKFHIYVSDRRDCEVVIRNIVGQELHRSRFTDNTTIDIESYRKGIYLVEIRDAKGSNRVVQKLTIQ